MSSHVLENAAEGHNNGPCIGVGRPRLALLLWELRKVGKEAAEVKDRALGSAGSQNIAAQAALGSASLV